MLRRWLPVAVLLVLLVSAFATGLTRYLDFETLCDNRERLLAFVAAVGPAAPVVFVAIYAAAVAVSLPGAVILTLIGGFVFGTWWGGLWSVVAATLGALAVFLVARTAVGDSLRDRLGSRFAAMEAGFRRNGFNYLLVLRLLPIFSFWLVNLAAAVLRVPARTYVAATVLGILPATFVFASVGAGLGGVLDDEHPPDLGIFTRPSVLLPLLGLAVVALMPVVYRRLKRPRQAAPS
ncbi:MAG: TVP38/TMEM64 family protein [Geminicoccaceae bacterium]